MYHAEEIYQEESCQGNVKSHTDDTRYSHEIYGLFLDYREQGKIQFQGT